MSREVGQLIIPSGAGLIPVEGLRFDSAIVPCQLNFDTPTSQALAELSITNGQQNTKFFGDISNPQITPTVYKFVRSLGDNDDEVVGLVAEAIIDLTREAALLAGDEAAWLELRAGSEAGPEFDVPRWHPDGIYFNPTPRKGHYKFATTLVGPQTLLGSTDERERFMELLRNRDSHKSTPEGLRIRRELDALVEKFELEQLGEAAFFLVGHDEAAIHSEPPMTGPRLFMFTLGGTLEQIEILAARWES